MYGDIYSADQVVKKTLFAKASVPLKRLPFDSSPVVHTVDPGLRVGEVYSWIEIKPGERKNIYWMFYDSNKKPYYAEHIPGRFSESELREQGALTVKEEIKEKKQQDETTKQFIERLFKYAMVTGGLFLLGKAVLPEIFKSRRSAA